MDSSTTREVQETSSITNVTIIIVMFIPCSWWYRHHSSSRYGPSTSCAVAQPNRTLLVSTVYCKSFEVEKFCCCKIKLYFAGKHSRLVDGRLVFCTGYFTGKVLYRSIRENHKTFPPRTFTIYSIIVHDTTMASCKELSLCIVQCILIGKSDTGEY